MKGCDGYNLLVGKVLLVWCKKSEGVEIWYWQNVNWGNVQLRKYSTEEMLNWRNVEMRKFEMYKFPNVKFSNVEIFKCENFQM